MNQGRYVFTQLTDFLPWKDFEWLVKMDGARLFDPLRRTDLTLLGKIILTTSGEIKSVTRKRKGEKFHKIS